MYESKAPTTRVVAPLVLAAATAVAGVAGTAVTTAARATAAPCSSWQANSQNLAFNLSNGQTAIFELNIDRNQFSDNARDAILKVPGSTDYSGNAQGLIAGGNGRIDFTVVWTPTAGDFGGPDIQTQTISSRFTGQISEDGTARGDADDNKGAHVNWSAPGAYSCADSAPKQDTPPAQNNPEPQPPTQVNCDDPAVADANGLICKTAPLVLFGPKDVVTMDIGVAFGLATVDIQNTSPDISGTCTYNATNVDDPSSFPVNRTFDLAKSGSTKFTLPAPLPSVTYHAVLSCKGPWNGNTVEFGHREQDVTAFG